MKESRTSPELPGFTVTEDPATKEWVATSVSGRFTLRGKDGRDLQVKRWDLYIRVLGECQQAIAETFPRTSWPQT